MKNAASLIQHHLNLAVKELYGLDISENLLPITPTRKEFQGDFTVVTFPLTKLAKKKPDIIGEELGLILVKNLPEIDSFNVIQGFLNLSFVPSFWNAFVLSLQDNPTFGELPANGERVLVEFSSPNTNKPLHLGHIRNILIGWSVSKILKAAGFDVFNVQIINDRGIAICKSMLARKIWGADKTPENTGIKGDFFVGSYYVLFEQKFQEEYATWQLTAEAREVFESKKKDDQSEVAFFKSYKDLYFNAYSELGKQAAEMLRNWEAGEEETIATWSQMNQWVYAGFDYTYKLLGVHFDKLYYESETYLLGKDIVQAGIEKSVFYKEADGSVWIDLTDVKLDKKVVLRKDGTSVYITQDLGTAELRYDDFKANKMIYVVADEQNYHFQVLFEIAKKLKVPFAEGLHHLSYGMVDLPTGKMKSREGTVVDADDLIAEVVLEARKNSEERGVLADLTDAERSEIIRKIGLAALKYFIIKVQPQKRMTFDPKESVDMQGQTGPYIQNAFVRIQSVLRKAGDFDANIAENYIEFVLEEREIIQQLYQYPSVIEESALQYDPSAIANYAYALAKNYHRFYHEHSILKADDLAVRSFRLCMSKAVGSVLNHSMNLLGIEMPDKM
ncbi:MAG: arginine--tRNA ligase [Saprospiraceae bacterium]|nr:arginine--tRNA ligase [Saprospiraceae bacterium]MDP4699430.1 arginine--tRNA ligase [Saprospiraceae bacterium]MDP4811106.1 arginine--tRNA ligase [Saprospiraceae bacterium]MDP4813725.1 arginine--tRNA ligase [Saprospiraceae bacterium]MDP4915964.1 arginine--tRNA ligase [Saprospiraceae bacterium]